MPMTRPMTITEKILARAAGRDERRRPGDFIMADVDLAMANDVTAPVADRAVRGAGDRRTSGTRRRSRWSRRTSSRRRTSRRPSSAWRCASSRRRRASRGSSSWAAAGSSTSLLPEQALGAPRHGDHRGRLALVHVRRPGRVLDRRRVDRPGRGARDRDDLAARAGERASSSTRASPGRGSSART